MISAQIMEVLSIDGERARVGADGQTQDVSLEIIDTRPVLGDRVMVHAGFALHLVDMLAEQKNLSLIHEIRDHDQP